MTIWLLIAIIIMPYGGLNLEHLDTLYSKPYCENQAEKRTKMERNTSIRYKCMKMNGVMT